MRAFAHEAVVTLHAGGDTGAPGAAITVELCGHWEHDPPCPLAPHHTAAERDGDDLRLRTLFVADPGREAEVRSRIVSALRGGGLVGRDGRETGWTLVSDRPSSVRADEGSHAERLTHSAR